MAKVYFNLITRGLRTLEEVPGTWQEATRQMLEEEGYTEQDGAWVKK